MYYTFMEEEIRYIIVMFVVYYLRLRHNEGNCSMSILKEKKVNGDVEN